MIFKQNPIRLTSLILMGVGIVLLGLNLFVDPPLNVALPLVFIMLGGGFVILVFAVHRLAWAPIFYLPAAFFLAMGFVFLLNVLTGDWTSWAYAWLFVIASLGVGLLLVEARLGWPAWIRTTAWGISLGGISLFVLFGAIAGGMFIQIMAPILLILGGLGLRWLRPDILSPRPPIPPAPLEPAAPPAADGLVEPPSARELEVLRLVDQGLSNQQIAERLNIAPSTVKTHINNLYGKMGVETRAQAIRRARDLGLLDE